MHVVIVDGDVSYPPNSGKRLRTLNLMLRLARRHRIGYICRASAAGPEFREAVDFLSDHGIETLAVEHPVPRKSGPLFYARLAANLLSPVPYSIASHHTPRLRATIAAYAARHRGDLWQRVEDMAAALADAIHAPDRPLAMAENGRRLVLDRYDWDLLADRLERIWEKCVQSEMALCI